MNVWHLVYVHVKNPAHIYIPAVLWFTRTRSFSVLQRGVLSALSVVPSKTLHSNGVKHAWIIIISHRNKMVSSMYSYLHFPYKYMYLPTSSTFNIGANSLGFWCGYVCFIGVRNGNSMDCLATRCGWMCAYVMLNSPLKVGHKVWW